MRNKNDAHTAFAKPILVWRFLGWGSAIALLMTPLVAMQFTREVNWDLADFVFATVIFGIVGALVELTVLLTNNWLFRMGGFVAVLTGFAVFWSNIAVGMIGSEGNATNLLFGVVLLIAIVGAWLSSLHRNVLPAAMLAAGAVQMLIGLFAGVWGSDFRGGQLTIALALLWWIASALFAVGNMRRIHARMT